MTKRIRWWVTYRLAARRSARARTGLAYALAHREEERIRYRRP